MPFKSFAALIKFFYTGKMDFDLNDAIAILQESEFYMIDSPSLLKQCSEVLKEKLAFDNCVEIFELASRFKIHDLKGIKFHIVKMNFKKFKKYNKISQ